MGQKNKVCKYKLSQHTFFVDRTIFANTFPDLCGDRLRIYLLMCRVVGAKNGKFFMSLNTILGEVNISEHYVRKAIDWLCENYFIKKVGRRGQVNEYIVLAVPDYHRDTKTYYTNESIRRDRYGLKDNLNGYCELPIEVMQGSILRDRTKWTDRKIKVLGQLYIYHWIDVYGGVDPEVLSFTANNSMDIKEFIGYSIDCHINDVKKVVRWLIREGYCHKVKTVYRINQNSCHKEFQYVGDEIITTLQTGDVLKDVIRLKYIPDLKLKDAHTRTGGRVTL